MAAYFPCPFCGSNVHIKASRQQSELFRVSYLSCTNQFGCGWRARFIFEYQETLQSSHLGEIDAGGNVSIFDKSKNPDPELAENPNILDKKRQMDLINSNA